MEMGRKTRKVTKTRESWRLEEDDSKSNPMQVNKQYTVEPDGCVPITLEDSY
jgi:hypothetical protein